ncbi:AsmA family protein [Lichenibacterium dinghuense]|uniref:AsmA family protein n=1 Tax=Lichenibacterium dinghuense TaxID=2895977 RepID=UPI001F158035|nr:AsmA-like C-terminal region-containing protein [Lichenibacterium sp. 6Y81]
MTRLAKLTAVILVAAALAAAAAPWRVSRTAAAKAFADGWGPDAGLHAVAAGGVTFKLLPRPRLQATGLSASAEDGAVLLDAPLLKADLDIPSLLRGVWRMSSATLVEPTLTVDVDRLAEGSAAAHAPSHGAPVMLRLRSGLLKTRSASGFADLLVTGIDASAAWDGRGEGLVVSGTATLRGTTAQFTGTLRDRGSGPEPAGSLASLQVESPLFDFSAKGVLSIVPQVQFAGRASFATPSLPRFLHAWDDAPASLASRRVQIGGLLVAKLHDLSLSDAQIRLDQTRLEGSLAWRQEAGRGLVAGTLATDSLDVRSLGDPDAPDIRDLYRKALTASPFATDVDLRISAATARLGRVTLEDAAFAALVRGERLEVTLDEARAYGGLVKARAVLTVGADGIGAHADVSAKRVDLGLLSDGLSGRARLNGTITARAALDGQGATLRDVVADLAGDGQVGVEGARVANLSLASALHRGDRRSPLDVSRRWPATVFDRAQWDVSIRDGTVRIPKGKLTAPGLALTFDAATGLPDGRVDLHAVAAEADAAGAPLRDSPTMPLDLRGFWAGPLVLTGGQGGFPAVALPLGGVAAER